MNILFFCWKSAANLLMWCKSKILYDISLFTKPFIMYWPCKYQIFMYLYNRDAKMLTSKNLKMEWLILIYTINKNNNKNNKKNQARITKAFEKFLVSKTVLSIITKIFLLCTLNDITFCKFFKFCWFEQSINTLKLKVSAPKSWCFCFLLLPNLGKIARKFKILATLYFYRFFIIFNIQSVS